MQVEKINIFQVEFNNVKVNSINARDLHKALARKTRFIDWFKRRIKEIGAIENEDYIRLLKFEKSESLGIHDDLLNTKEQNKPKFGGDQRSIEYIISLDLAKEFAMLERNNIGRQVRRYFIQFERDALHEINILKEQITILNQLNEVTNKLLGVCKSKLRLQEIDQEIEDLQKEKNQITRDRLKIYDKEQL